MTTLQPGESIKPIVSLSQAKQLVWTYFGVAVGKIKLCNSYDDKNFYIQVENAPEKKFIFKVLNSMDSQKNVQHVEAEHGLMLKLSSKGLQCPIPQKTVDGHTFKIVQIPTEDSENANVVEPSERPLHLIRLLSFVEGKIIHEVTIMPKLFHKAGAYIAQILNIFKECKFPALENYNSIWKLGNVLELSKFIYVIQDQSEKFQLVNSVLNAYKNDVVPILHTLKKGIVHGDYNEQNILVKESSKGDYEISGIIDFGDSNYGPYIFELGITVCYMMLEALRSGVVDPFEAAANTVAGYAKYMKVSDSELKLMRTLIASRLCQSLILGAYSYSLDPGNEYLLTTESRGWILLDQVWNKKTDQQMMDICKQFLN